MVIWQIDDDPLHLELAAILLRRANPRSIIRSFENGQQAVDLLESEQPDLIMLDLNMPGMNGWDFLEHASSIKKLPPIVVLTSSIDPRDRSRAFDYKCVKDFLVKPVRMADLIGLAIEPGSPGR